MFIHLEAHVSSLRYSLSHDAHYVYFVPPFYFHGDFLYVNLMNDAIPPFHVLVHASSSILSN